MDEETIRTKFNSIRHLLSEKCRRIWAATEARAIGKGGVSLVSNATGMSQTTIRAGIAELANGAFGEGEDAKHARIRAPGGGRKGIETRYPGITAALYSLIEPGERGQPNSPLRWTTLSLRKLAEQLNLLGYPVSSTTVMKMLHAMGFSTQALSKVLEGKEHIDRDRQFRHIANESQLYLELGEPVISVDTKKKELVGQYYNKGVEWHPKGTPEKVNDHDFPDPTLGKAIPYGVYDIGANTGFVNVGVDHDTPEFAVHSIRTWWNHMGKKAYPNATMLYITADSGGSNGYRVRAWKTNLQSFADESGLRISVSHLPPGTSKWNKIEHRMFSHITMNWRGRPLETMDTIINLIGVTTTKKGLRIEATVDRNEYTTGVKISDTELDSVRIDRQDFHGEWNYTITPHNETTS